MEQEMEMERTSREGKQERSLLCLPSPGGTAWCPSGQEGDRDSPGQVSVTLLSPGQQPARSFSFFPDQSSPREQPGT